MSTLLFPPKSTFSLRGGEGGEFWKLWARGYDFSLDDLVSREQRLWLRDMILGG